MDIKQLDQNYSVTAQPAIADIEELASVPFTYGPLPMQLSTLSRT